jgi:hypothetical protein
MSLGSPDFYKAIVGVANKKSWRTPALAPYTIEQIKSAFSTLAKKSFRFTRCFL